MKWEKNNNKNFSPIKPLKPRAEKKKDLSYLFSTLHKYRKIQHNKPTSPLLLSHHHHVAFLTITLNAMWRKTKTRQHILEPYQLQR